MVAAKAQEPAPEAIVDAMEKNSGTHAGKRRSGAKGVCASGEFVSTGAGARLTSAAPFQPGGRFPVMARFSNGGGNPQAPDNAPAVRGMSLAFTLPGNDSFEMVMINAPAFGASTLESFVRLLRVAGAGPDHRPAGPAADRRRGRAEPRMGGAAELPAHQLAARRATPPRPSSA